MAIEQHGRVRVERSAKRLRGYLGGELVFDTTTPLLVWEIPYYPTYYVPESDVIAELAGLVCELTGSAGDVVYVPRPEDDPTVRRPDITLARAELGGERRVAPPGGRRRPRSRGPAP